MEECPSSLKFQFIPMYRTDSLTSSRIERGRPVPNSFITTSPSPDRHAVKAALLVKIPGNMKKDPELS
jgi:hypothetical protein